MRKLVASLFVIAALAMSFGAVAGASNGRADNGSPGNYDNCTGNDQGNGYQFQEGSGWYYAAYYCFG